MVDSNHIVSMVLWTLTLYFLLTPAHSAAADVREYCAGELFNVSCPNDAVIVMDSARYGRMRLGRCVRANLGYVGCSKDILDLLDKRCSGLRSCTLYIPGDNSFVNGSCPWELKQYLEAGYRCQKVQSKSCSNCSARTDIQAGSEAGYILPIDEGQCGMWRCAWTIRAQPGQRISLTILEFDPWKSQRDDVCHVRAVVRENHSSQTICKGHQRRTVHFRSLTNILVVEVARTRGERPGSFLLMYNATGCPDFEAAPNLTSQRDGDKLTVMCPILEKKWTLFCRDREWTGPEISCETGVKAPEYCDSEVFKVSCSPGKVIVMVKAVYGRMRLGRCVSKDFGYLGCSEDVLYYLDKMCSGRKSCEVNIPDAFLKQRNPCHRELRSYLEAQYKCVDVHHQKCATCCFDSVIKAQTGSGYIAASSMNWSRCDDFVCAWMIQAKPGQHIVFTLQDFNHTQSQSHPSGCQHHYASIDEDNGRAVICRGNQRTRMVYESKANEVMVVIPEGNINQNQSLFLLHYEITGCPDYVAPPNMWVKKEKDRVVIVCGTSVERWTIVCKNNQWIGMVGTCRDGNATSGNDTNGGQQGMTSTQAPTVTTAQLETGEYCKYEQFTASCSTNEVIVIEAASYGRMQIGRCINRDYGYVGCQADVKQHLGTMCNGQQSCRLNVAQAGFPQPCPEDLSSYLLASYRCTAST